MSPLFRLEGRRERSLFSSKEREYKGKVRCALKRVRHEFRHLKPPLVGEQFGGAPHVDPKYLSICLLFKDDYALTLAEQLGYFPLLRNAVMNALREECYPQASVADVQIEFASRKALKRDGGFWNLFH
jgi:hypothetical protein